MRIPIPTKVDPKLATLFIVALFMVELAQGTEVTFAALVALWMALFFGAFTLCGGIVYPSGAWIGFFGLATAFIGILGKMFLFEPAHTNLTEPTKTMAVYCAGMASAGFGAWMGHRLAPRRALLEDFIQGETLHRASIGCLAAGLLLSVATDTLTPPSPGSILAILQQLNQFPRVAIILATYYSVKSTDGRKTFNWVVLVAGANLLYLGLLVYSKEGIFFPFVAWLLSAILAGGQFTKKQLLGLAVLAFLMLHYLVPFSQYGRQSRVAGAGYGERTATVLTYLTDLEGTRKLYLAAVEAQEDQAKDSPHYYNQEQGLLGREQMLAFDDSLIKYTDEGNVYGLTPELISLANVVPHFLWPNKPEFSAGNFYGRELGVIDSDDETTGISFSPVGDAYHQGKWLAVIFVLPMVVFMYSFFADSLVGNTRRSPWALLPIAISANIAPEALMGGTIYMATFTLAAVIFAALVSRFVFPFFVSLVMGSTDKRVRGRLNFTPAARRDSLLDRAAAGAEPGSGPA